MRYYVLVHHTGNVVHGRWVPPSNMTNYLCLYKVRLTIEISHFSALIESWRIDEMSICKPCVWWACWLHQNCFYVDSTQLLLDQTVNQAPTSTATRDGTNTERSCRNSYHDRTAVGCTGIWATPRDFLVDERSAKKYWWEAIDLIVSTTRRTPFFRRVHEMLYRWKTVWKQLLIDSIV